MMTARGGC